MMDKPPALNKPAAELNKANYGIDAPGVIRNLMVIGLMVFIISMLFPVIKIKQVEIYTGGFVWSGISCMVMGLLMILYARYGKLVHRDRMLSLINWLGDEQVLDVGTGKGVMMIGAAKKLSTGISTGIDIWNTEDLTNNTAANALANAAAEGVADKVTIFNENVMQMSFADETFDVIVSNLCIHNIYNSDGRTKACTEIARVLKKGGTAIISDFKHVRAYQQNFNSLGLQTRLLWPNYLSTFPPLRILVAKK